MTRDMTKGSPIRRILEFCVPLLIGNLFQQFYNLADSIIVGRFIGVNAFAAVGSTGSLNFLVLGFALGICSGFAIPIAQSFGANDEARLRRQVGQAIWLGVAFSLLITAVTFFGTRKILEIVNTPPEIFEDAYTYIFIVFMGVGATILYNLASGILRALGDSRTPLLFLIIACAINVVLDIVFITVFGMGVEGAAYATVIAQLASGLLCLAYIKQRVPVLWLKKEDLRPDWKEMCGMMGAGVPMGLQFSITAIGSIILQSAVNKLGAMAVAAVSAGTKVHLILATPLETIGITMATYCGQNLGARRIDRVREGVRKITLIAMLYCVIGFLLEYYAGVGIATLFVDASETAILADVHLYLAFNGAGLPLLAVVFIYRNSLQGLGFSNSAMLAGLSELVARALVAYVLVASLGFAGACWASPMAWLFADLILLPLYFIKMKKLAGLYTSVSSPSPCAAE